MELGPSRVPPLVDPYPSTAEEDAFTGPFVPPVYI
jgi:hypothetical protein